ncbi:MAG: hypothetical protein WDA27_06035 [Actinomycetota bacterium]
MRPVPIDEVFQQVSGEGTAVRSPDWHRIVSEGRVARAAADGGHWRIGELAMLVERRYRAGTLKRFAEEIGESLGTVRRLRWVAAAYDGEARALFPQLSLSHFQVVAALPDRLIWLERAQRGSWSVDRLTVEARTANAQPLAVDLRMRRPVESALRSIARLTNSADDRALSRAARAGLSESVDELAREVERLRARIEKAERRRRRRRTAGNGGGRAGRLTLADAPAARTTAAGLTTP